MTTLQPLPGWWLTARASGLVTLTLVALNISLGLAMASRLVPAKGGWRKAALKWHEHLAWAALGMLVLHGVAIAFDPTLHTNFAGVLVPGVLGWHIIGTSIGIVTGWLMLVLSLTFYARRRLGGLRWRKAHRLMPLIWLGGMVHALNGGSDVSNVVVLAILGAPFSVIAALLAVRWGKQLGARGLPAVALRQRH